MAAVWLMRAWKSTATPVWVLIEFLEAADGDKARVARDYEISAEAIEAAFAFYRQHKAIIDVKLPLNAA